MSTSDTPAPHAAAPASDEPTRTLTIGLLGCGTVGSGVVRLLNEHAEEIAGRLGARLVVGPVAVRNTALDREPRVERLTSDPMEVVEDPEVDIVVEVMGGIEPARGLISAALERGRPVVTANKELVATLGAELFDLADAKGTRLEYEAAVAGGIPIIKPMRESLAGDRVRKVLGILNGTTNYILTKMTEEGVDFGEALAEAQRLGYAERDPAADIEDFDAAAKAAILASIAFDARVVAGDVFREGITRVTAVDIAHARRMGYVIKLLAIAERDDDGEIGVRVHPALIPAAHPLASVRESFNAVFVEAEAVGDLMFYGRGAGSLPTASAVLGDIVTVARALLSGERPTSGDAVPAGRIRPFEDTTVQYYVLLDVADEAGVLAAVASTFGAHDVSIKSVWQDGSGDSAQLLLITHAARERNVQATLHDLRELGSVRNVASVMRVEGGEA
jgi:homoserine dehydrogenase